MIYMRLVGSTADQWIPIIECEGELIWQQSPSIPSVLFLVFPNDRLDSLLVGERQLRFDTSSLNSKFVEGINPSSTSVLRSEELVTCFVGDDLTLGDNYVIDILSHTS